MRVLGLDLSTKPGFAVMDDGSTLVAHGTAFLLAATVERSPAWDHVLDYMFIDVACRVAQKVAAWIHDFQPDMVAIEQTNQGRSRTTQKELEFIHFAVLQEIRRLGYQYKLTYIDSSRWRSLCEQKMTKEQRKHNKEVTEGKMRGKIRKKHLAVAWANQKFGLSLIMKDEDAADAIGIAYGAWRQRQITNVGKIDVDKVLLGS